MSPKEINKLAKDLIKREKVKNKYEAWTRFCEIYFEIFCASYNVKFDKKAIKGVVPANSIQEAHQLGWIEAKSKKISRSLYEDKFVKCVRDSVNRMAQEGVDFSMSTRNSSLNSNPSSPTVPSDTYDEIKVIREFFHNKELMEMFKGANAIFTRAYLKKKLGMNLKAKTGQADLEFIAKGEWPDHLNTVMNRYYQYVVAILFAKAVSTVLLTDDALVEKILVDEQIVVQGNETTEKQFKRLNSKSFRKKFIKNIYTKLNILPEKIKE